MTNFAVEPPTKSSHGEPATLAEKALIRIYGMIMSGELPLGGVVNEVALAEQFGISRGPVREAVQRLQGFKLVTREPFLKARVVSLSPKDVVEIFQLRESVEGMACRLATLNMTDEALAQLVSDFQRTFDTGTDSEASFDLHEAVARACGNKRVEFLLCEELYHLLRLYRRRSGSAGGRSKRASEEHWQILRAMRARDAYLAESLVRSHISRATDNLVQPGSGEQVL